MSKRFNGVINLDIRESVPDWDPYVQPKAPEGAPNVLFVVWDDTGFGALSPFGGPIEMPTMQRLADNGLRYTQFHTTSICSPTRAAMLTGRNHTTVGMACIAEATQGFPGMNGHIPFETALIGEVLGERGYNTYMLGKWHCVAEDETNMASSKRNWPTGRGFERFYGFLGGETNQYYPDLCRDQQFVEQPSDPVSVDEWLAGEDGYMLTADLVDNAIGMIGDAKQIAPERPFFMYFCPGANHAPHQPPKAWADRYKGVFDMGYEAIREQILAKQKELGVLPENTELSPINPLADLTSVDGKPFPEQDMVRPWDSLTEEEKKLFIRMAEVYAGYSSYADEQIGRLVDYLDETGELDNTIIVVISDNGASGEGGPNGSVNENKFFNSVPDDMEENLKLLDMLGSPGTYNHYPTGWALAFNTPFKLFKRSTWEGGVCDPMIVHWPAGIKSKGELRHQYTHVIDVVPTVFECMGIELPEQVNGYTQWPLEGTSFAYTFDESDAKTQKDSQFYQMLGTRALWRNGWKVDALHAGAPSGWSHFAQDKWALYHTDEDRAELHDVGDQYPELRDELVALWHTQAGQFFGLPLDDRSAQEILTTPRPQMTPDRNRYIYYPGTLEVPEAVAVNIRGRSYKIAADVVIDEGADGVIFAHGHVFGGHALYVKGGRLQYVYNYLGEREQTITSDIAIPTGRCILGVEFAKERLETIRNASVPNQCIGNATLYINDQKVGEFQDMATQLGKFALAGEGLNVGRDGGAPVTFDYPGARPWAFTGGTIKKVVFDVSGEAYRDYELEVTAMMSRD
ncbi:arylsulfatase [Prescottella agglutinans]|uniref:Arylsulfatase A-like enzyme n=1 Tax=Prescottella agglutinans TaxID=1644129 RepID=A0ABT6M628_9NOCA|nr:arylsulfatase [Prescottella agglutinans]MDH6279768.1 arylsulfatase A-like enzyme [Prescottella agglutinans]